MQQLVTPYFSLSTLSLLWLSVYQFHKPDFYYQHDFNQRKAPYIYGTQALKSKSLPKGYQPHFQTTK